MQELFTGGKAMASPKFHPASVRSVLKMAGFKASAYHRSGMVKGWGDRTEGFRLHIEYGDKQVWHQASYARRRTDPSAGYMATVYDTSVVRGIRVEWCCGSWFRGDQDAVRKGEEALMAAALSAAGYKTEEDRLGLCTCLRVSVQ